MAQQISKGKARKVAREDAAAAAKIIHIQELQIAALEHEVKEKGLIITDLQTRLLIAEARAAAAKALFDSAYDYVDKLTGQIVRAVWVHQVVTESRDGAAANRE